MDAKVPHLRVVQNVINNQRENHKIPSVATEAERIAYMADLILELKGMADKSGLNTLSGILEVAYVEAKSHARKA